MNVNVKRIPQIIYNRNPIRIIKDDRLRELDNQRHAYKKVIKFCDERYNSVLNSTDLNRCEVSEHSFNNDVWVYWAQGWKNTPQIIEICNKSLNAHLKDWNIHLLDDDNIDQYVEIPDIIRLRRLDNKISIAHYSDIIRLLLLEKWGGIWIDSTVFFSGSDMINELKTLDLFMFQDIHNPYANVSNWLILAKSNSRILAIIKSLLLDFYSTHDCLYHYFMFHMIVNYVSKKECSEWNKMPVYLNCQSLLLGSQINNEYRENVYQAIISQTDIHKLSYKCLDETKKSSYYKYIINLY